jgi:hypothetical protein
LDKPAWHPLTVNGKRNDAAIAAPDCRGSVVVLKQLPGLYLKALSDPRNVVDRDIAFGALHAAQVRSINVALMGEGFLA